jgi:hypothetical protein
MRRRLFVPLILVVLVAPARADDAPPAAPPGEGWKPLFNGKDLSGWKQINGTAKYAAEGGCIVGTTSAGSPNSFLCSAKDYGNFELVFEVKVDDRLNSGVQVRSHSKPDFKNRRVHGPQVEIATNGNAGRLWDEARRAKWLDPQAADAPARAAFKKGEWNKFRVLCEGDRYRTWVNGVPVADVRDGLDATGLLGLQVHGIPKGQGPYQVRWRGLYLRELGTAGP